MRTLQAEGRDLAFPAAVPAADPDRKKLRLDACALCDGPFGKHVQIDLDTLRDDPSKLPHTYFYGADFHSALSLCFFETVIEQMLCNTQFVHNGTSPGIPNTTILAHSGRKERVRKILPEKEEERTNLVL